MSASLVPRRFELSGIFRRIYILVFWSHKVAFVEETALPLIWITAFIDSSPYFAVPSLLVLHLLLHVYLV